MKQKELIEHIENFRNLKPGWDSYGAVVIDPRAIGAAGAFIEYLCATPTSSGGVQIEAHTDKIEFELYISAEGRLTGVSFEQVEK